MESSDEYFVNHDGETSGPFGLEKVREKLHSGQFKPDDLIVSEGGSEWLALSEVLKPDKPAETPLQNEKEATDLAVKAVRSATMRDSFSGDGIDVLVVNKDGITEFTEDVK